MTDLHDFFPDFNIKPYTHLVHSLEKNDITVADLISLDPIEVARKCPLPLLDVRRLVEDVVRGLQRELGMRGQEQDTSRQPGGPTGKANRYEDTGDRTSEDLVKTLDPVIDEAIGGGLPPGYITEIVGESAVGKTQFVLGLLLSVQLPPPRGRGKGAIYLSTESGLNTTRLHQILASHPAYAALPPSDRPSLDHVHTISTNDLEAQEHIIQYQLPIAVQRFNVGLVVLDSVAANFRAEHETRTAAGLADRATELAKLGSMLRRIAVENQLAIVVVNQVSDRIDDTLMKDTMSRLRSSSPVVSSSPIPHKSPMPAAISARRAEILSLDHQQRFFTGWGDQPGARHEELKNPTLGLAWANQISARIVLKMESERCQPPDYRGGNIWKDKKKKRSLGVVFAPWVEPTIPLVGYEIAAQGVMSASEEHRTSSPSGGLDAELLDAEFWTDEDEEFP